ncbi:Sphingomyelin phosphodiesterase 5 [Lamellibrachia satsuma]|nr:Sphingomyelin phosphodiesterase 5 [Lamellibrachia satsuma]
MPLAIVALLVWMLIQHKRKPYRFSYVDGAGSTFKMTFGIATANICLLPECGSRFNNLFNTRWRAQEIGRRIVQQQLKYDNDNKQNGTGSSCHVHNDHKRCENFGFHHYISETFPSVDFLLVQEAFDLGYTQELVTKLHAVFPYIIYDVGYSSFNSNMYMCNSGMLLASKFPVEKVHFNWYKHSCNQCRFACKGVLQVKVCLAHLKDGRNIVGYIFNTHLQSYEGDVPIQRQQLNELMEWTEQFRRTTLNDNDIVAFDLLGGDFNLDNMSPAHKETIKHKLFSSYVDVCCKTQGQDHDWTVGTEMRQIPLQDLIISTPEGLKMMLEDPRNRQYYILDADVQIATMKSLATMAKTDEDGNVLLSPSGGRRRVDMILYRNVHDDRASERSLLKVTSYSTVTQLASLTDHLPVAITFTIDLAAET